MGAWSPTTRYRACASTFGWFERVGDVMVAERGEVKRSMIRYGANIGGGPEYQA